jgi:hypothetical protein
MADVSQRQPSLLELCSAVSHRIAIKSIRLSRSGVYSVLRMEDFPIRLKYTVNVKTEHDRNAKSITVTTSFNLSARPSVSDDTGEQSKHDSTPPPLAIQTDFILEYLAPSFEGISQEQIDAFGKMNGVYNAWPYWREYVQSTTTRFGLPPLILPVLTGEAIQDLYKKSEESGDGEPSAQSSSMGAG